MRVAIVGGGITGLSAAFELVNTSGPERDAIDVSVFEAGERFGGKIRTRPFAGHPLDEGADAFLARGPEAIELCRQLGLGERLVSPATRRAYLFSLGELRPFPDGLVLGVPTDLEALRASSALTPDGVERAGLDLTMGPDPVAADGAATPDESVGSLVRRRVGDEVFERLVAPLLSGVHAGDADRLSVAAGAPQFAAAMRSHGSLIEGLRAQLAAAGTQADAPIFLGLPEGTGALVDALVDALHLGGTDLRLGSPVERLVAAGRPGRPGGFTLEVAGQGQPVDVDAVILTTPLETTAKLIAPVRPDLADEMAAVDYAEVALLALSVPLDQLGRPLDGSGFLVAQPEGLLLTACSWASSKWAHLTDPEVAILRASVGRADDTRAASMADDALIEAVLGDLRTTMGLRGRPREVRVTRWPRALPQFAVGHLDRAAAWQQQLAGTRPGLAVAGAGVLGLGIPACIRQGREAARRVLDQLSPDAPGASR
jgi:protoporphyrinogen/coproporphyrinogen III oxidase